MKLKINSIITVSRKYGWLFLAACAAMLAGCTADDTLPADGSSDTPVAFTAGIESAALPSAKSPGTRTATGANGQTVWTQGDAVGIFMLTAGGTMPGDILLGADNREHNVAPTSGALSPAGTPIYYPQAGKVDFIALYPYSNKGTGNGKITSDYRYAISVADQTNPEAIDVLYAKAKGHERTKSPVALGFRHVLSKIKLNIKLGDGLAGLTADNITAVTLAGMPASATLALQDGTLTPGAAGNIAAVKEATPSTGAMVTFTALVPPQAANSFTRRLIVTVDGEDYTGTIPAADVYKNNEMNIYPVTVQKPGIIVGEPAIVPWGTNDHDTGTANEVIKVVRIPAGTFQMGSPETDTDAHNDEKPRHWVRLTKDFYLGKYEVTRTQYAEFLNATGVPKADAGQYATATVEGHGTQKLFRVNEWGWTPTWNDATGRWEADGDYPMIYVAWYGAKAYADWVGGRLPTEAEWEYACRAGTTTRYSFGDDASMLGDYAVYRDNKVGDSPSRVGTKMPNPWGLYDMHGNVFEWCMDSGGDTNANYPTTPTEADAVVNPQVAEGQYRVFRGGSWYGEASSSRSAYRNSSMPGNVYHYTGFRVAFSLSE